VNSHLITFSVISTLVFHSFPRRHHLHFSCRMFRHWEYHHQDLPIRIVSVFPLTYVSLIRLYSFSRVKVPSWQTMNHIQWHFYSPLSLDI
jgi:hypothetical protein